MKKKMKLYSSILAIMLCMAMIAGATFALFTSESKINIAVNAATVDVEAYIDTTSLMTYSMGVEQDVKEEGDKVVGDFELGGKATLDQKSLDLNQIAPGDKAIFDINVVNKSSIDVLYKVTWEFNPVVGENATDEEKAAAQAAADTLTAALIMTATTETKGEQIIGTSGANVGWTTLKTGTNPEKVSVVIELPYDATNACMTDRVSIDFTVEAKQGNAPIEREADIENFADVLAMSKNGDTIKLVDDQDSGKGENNSDSPLTETIVIDKEITLNPNGMYLVSSAPATFTVVEGGKLTVGEGSFTIKNTSTNGAAVLVDGGEFIMQGGSFDAHTAVRTTEGKSSTVAMTAGWSNRVTVSFDSKGNDTINVTGGTIYSGAEAIKTTAGTHVNVNISGGLLSSRTSQYSAAVNLQGTATVNMTGGKIENTYSSGFNGSPAIEANVTGTTINLSGSAALSSNGTAVMLGSHLSEPAVLEGRIVLNMSGNASISATSVMGFGIRYAQDCCDVTISGNAKVNATFQAIQFNTNNYVYTNSTLTVSENATITSTAGSIGGGYAIASNGNVQITGGTIYGSTAGIASFQAGAVVVIDNSTSGTPITINSTQISEGVTYTVAGNPSIG